jgi:hypothetical protein
MISSLTMIRVYLSVMVFALLLMGAVESAYGTSVQKPSRSVAQEAKVVIEDTVFRVEPHSVGHRVMFRVHSGIYYLKSSSKYYDSILSTLNSSRDKGEPIKVKADATSLEIEELIINAK